MSGAVSPDGQYLFYPIISGSDETGPVGGINRINLATGTTDTFAVGRLRPSALKAQSGTSVFVGAGYGYLGRWDLSGRTWREAQRLRFNNNSEITFPASPTNDTVFWNEQRNQYDIRYLVVRGNTLFAAVALTYVFFANAVNDMDVNADGSRVAIADADNKVVIWNGPQSPSTFWLYNTKWEMHGVSIAGDSLVASGSGAAFQLLHV
ncbi:hypothetical protein BC829DRAFT_384977 [Chytridium lagenaria]|nr:hypothetical protein BC829DRAFT_384977 [Chytridium lagenaria]